MRLGGGPDRGRVVESCGVPVGLVAVPAQLAECPGAREEVEVALVQLGAAAEVVRVRERLRGGDAVRGLLGEALDLAQAEANGRLRGEWRFEA